MNALSYEALASLDPHTAAVIGYESAGVGYAHGLYGQAGQIRARLDRLDPATRREVIRRATEWGVGQFRAHGFSGLGQDSAGQIVGGALQRVLAPTISAAVDPAAQKMAQVIGPVIEEKLRKYGPIVGAIAGILAGVISIIGMVVIGGYVVKKVG